MFSLVDQLNDKCHSSTILEKAFEKFSGFCVKFVKMSKLICAPSTLIVFISISITAMIRFSTRDAYLLLVAQLRALIVSLELQSLNSTFNRGGENKFSSAPLWSVIFSQSFALQVVKYCYEPFNKQICDFITFCTLCLSISRLALQLWIYQ